jgi:hypothetical protein
MKTNLQASHSAFFQLDPDVVHGAWRILTFDQGQDAAKLVMALNSGQPAVLGGILRLRRTFSGPPVDVCFVPPNIPVVSARASAILRKLAAADVQLYPVQIDSSASEFQLVNIRRSFDCFDESHSILSRTETGEIVAVVQLAIRPAAVEEARIFRMVGRTSVIIIDEQLRTGFADAAITGVEFTPVLSET